MILEIPKATTFECPEGIHQAVLHEVREKAATSTNGSDKTLRLVFEVKLKRPDHRRVLVGKNFQPTLAPGSELRQAIDSWKGEEFLVTAGDKLDLTTLVSQEAEIHVQHLHNSKYKQPFVQLLGVFPPGTSTQTQ